MKSFLGNYYRYLAIFYWSHCLWWTIWLSLWTNWIEPIHLVWLVLVGENWFLRKIDNNDNKSNPFLKQRGGRGPNSTSLDFFRGFKIGNLRGKKFGQRRLLEGVDGQRDRTRHQLQEDVRDVKIKKENILFMTFLLCQTMCTYPDTFLVKIICPVNSQFFSMCPYNYNQARTGPRSAARFKTEVHPEVN